MSESMQKPAPESKLDKEFDEQMLELDKEFKKIESRMVGQIDPMSRASMFCVRDKLIIIGGYSKEYSTNNIYEGTVENMSVKWTKSKAPWKSRYSCQAVTISDKLYVISGRTCGGDGDHEDYDNFLSDIWVYNNIEWKLLTDKISIGSRFGVSNLVLINDKMIYVGGWTSRNKRHDYYYFTKVHETAYKFLDNVVSSTDGIKWKTQSDNNAWGPRSNHSVVSNGEKMFIIGGRKGFNCDFENDIWMSVDEGVSWKCMNESCDFSKRSFTNAVMVNDSIIVIGGMSSVDGIGELQNDVWKSVDDGITWTCIQPELPFETLYYSSITCDKSGRIYIFGGQYIYYTTNSAFSNDLWISDDGIKWNKCIDNQKIETSEKYTKICHADRKTKYTMCDIVVVCHGNRDRSPFIASIMSNYLKNLDIQSAGISGKNGYISSESIKAIEFLGLPLPKTFESNYFTNVPIARKAYYCMNAHIQKHVKEVIDRLEEDFRVPVLLFDEEINDSLHTYNDYITQYDHLSEVVKATCNIDQLYLHAKENGLEVKKL